MNERDEGERVEEGGPCGSGAASIRVVPMAFLSFGTYEALRVVLDRAVDEALGVGAVPAGAAAAADGGDGGDDGGGGGAGGGRVVAQVAENTSVMGGDVADDVEYRRR